MQTLSNVWLEDCFDCDVFDFDISIDIFDFDDRQHEEPSSRLHEYIDFALFHS